MISFDQVLLLEEKVESAVKKIEQLNAENAALRSKCAELSNALEAKTEQFSSFESNQSKIEEGILKALSRLNAVENVVLSASAAQSPSASGVTELHTEPQPNVEESVLSPAGANPTVSEPLIQASDSALVNVSVSQPVSSQPEASEQQPPQVQAYNQPALQNEADSFSSSESLAPNVDFEFGDSEPASLENPQQVSGQSSASASAPSQPMFDIF
ncbi:MAG: cell division protein ZapB [Treponema sp.]|nr:cell division protein ZapB [Treponema sp.]